MNYFDGRRAPARSLKRAALLGCAAAIAIPQIAMAQDATSQGNDAAQLEEIVVTARRSAENLQDVPVAVTALGAEQLERSFATNITDLHGVAPNVTLEMLPAFGRTASYWIRGAGLNDGEASFEGPVGVVVDGVYISRTSGSVVDAFDLESVEILRGPQGTLFGKNTTGGLINITTKRPSGDFGVEAEARIGSHGRQDFSASIEAPIVEDRIATRLSVRSFNSDGFTTNLVDDRTIGGDNAWGVRSVTSFNNGGAFDGVLSLDYLKDQGEFAVVNLATTDGDFFFTCRVAGSCYNGDPRQNYTNTEPRNRDQETFHGALTLNWDLGDHVLTSVTGYHAFKDNKTPIDFDGTPHTIFHLERHEDEEELSQEFRIERQRDGSRLHYMAGVYAFQQTYDVYSFTFIRYLGLTPRAQFANGELRSIAAFASADYDLTDRLTLSVGGRLTRETKTIEQSFSSNAATLAEQLAFYENGTPLPTDFEGEINANNFAPRASLSWQATPDVMLYGSYSKGFKSGGFSNRATDPVSARPYDDEEVDAFELGFKGDLLNRSLRINAALFRNDFQGLQRLIGQPTYDDTGAVSGTTSSIINAADAIIEGFEAEVVWVPNRWFRFDGNMGYLDAQYTDFCGSFIRAGAGSADADCVAQTGDAAAVQNDDLKMPYAPEWTAGAGVTFTHDLANGSILNADVRVSYQSEQAIILSNELFRPSVTLWDASLRWTDPTDRYTVAVYGKNLTDEAYPVTGGNVGFTRFGMFNEPRSFGVQLNVSLGR